VREIADRERDAELPAAEARGWLDEIGEIIQPVHVRLVARDSRYAAPLRGLARLIGVEPMPGALVDEAAGEPRDDSRAALDRVWAEAPVTFGPDQPGPDCGATKQRREQPVQWHGATQGRSI
jgi:nitrate reductase delta subunit